MAALVIPVVEVPFQESLSFTDNDTAVPSGLEVQFVNDGYTIFVVNNAAMSDNDVTISAIPDNAGRDVNYTATVTAESTMIFGPFRPVWWNQAGVVTATFESDTTTTCAAIRLQF